MSGSNYPRAPSQGYAVNPSYGGYPANVTYYQNPPGVQYPQPQVVPPFTGYVVAPTAQAGGPPAYTEAPPPYTEHPQNPQPGIQQNLQFENAFDYRARFDGISQPRIPPPPPGVAPNAAQLAAMQGHHVTGTQEHRDVTWSFD